METSFWYLINWNRLSCIFMFACECRLSKILNRTFQKASQGFVSIKYGEIVEHGSFDESNMC